MIDSEIRDQAYKFFIEEAVELLYIIESGLLNLKENRNPAKVHEIMRAAHSLKGGAATVELEEIKIIAHRLEDIFKALYNDTVEIDRELENLLLTGFDALRYPLMEQIETGSFDRESSLNKATNVLEKIEAKLGDNLGTMDNFIPSSSDLGIDMVASIFEVDVTREIERLEKVIAHPTDYQVAGELMAVTEIFSGFAELLDLPGFGEIATTAATAVNLYPEQAIKITELAIADFQLACAQVLAGDRTQGGKASAVLLAYTQPDSLTTNFDTASLDDVFADLASESKNFSELTKADFPEELAISSLDELFAEVGIAPETTTPPVSWHDAVAKVETGEIQPKSPLNSEEIQEANQENFADISSPQQPIVTTEVSSIPDSQPTPEKAKTEKTKQNSSLSVKVDLSRLEKMNNVLGELTINRNSLSLHNQQLQGNVKELRNKFSHFQTIIHKLREIYGDIEFYGPRYLNKPKNHQEKNDRVPKERQKATDFDSLEMDTYHQVDYLVQEVLEQMMQLEEGVDNITLASGFVAQSVEQQRPMLTNLGDELMWARMLPLSSILNRFPRLLRDLSYQYHKPVNFQAIGADLLVDKAILEKLYDPLFHLIINAFDHGIELPDIRRRQGKLEQGEIKICAYHQGNRTIIEIQDNGQGIDLKKITQKAIKQGLLSPEKVANTSKKQILDFIFEPGFSTAQKVDQLSGRGVGLDVVRSQLKEIKGTISVDYTQGKGTTFTLSLPLTLTIAKLLICLFGKTAVALPSESIEEIIIPNSGQIKKSGEGLFLDHEEQLIPIYRLVDLLQYNCPLPIRKLNKAFAVVTPPEDWALPLLILRQGKRLFALEVERLISEQELVIKPFGVAIPAPIYTYGCTILADGSLIPVIDAILLVDYVLEAKTLQKSRDFASQPPPSAPTIQGAKLLIVDDSSALRRTLALNLERAGYLVLQAKDGREALSELGNNLDIKLVICDLEMPNMNGFEFLSQRRLNADFTKIPVAMLTSRNNPKHRQLAIQLGANAYFTKPYIEQDLLAEIENIIG